MNMIEIKKTLFAVFICLMGHIVALAQKYQVRPLDLEQGLSCNYVVSIAQDKYGFLWFATEEGLNRFDGNSFFTYYKQRDRKGISSSELNCVIDDAKEPVVWIGTKNDGLNSFNYQTEEWHSYKHDGKNPSSIATNDITHITPSANGKLWITTYWKGVELFDPETKRFVHFDKNRVKGLPDNQLWCVLDLGNGNLLVGHVKSGLSIIDTQRLTARNFKHNDQDIFSISGNEVICLYRDKKGTIWIGTNVGIDIYDPLSQRFLHVADQTIKNHRIFDFCELPDGNMLVATEQMGIAVLDVANKSFTASTQISCSFISEGFSDFNLTGNSVRSLLLDKYNNVWAGFYGSGINFLTQSVAPFSTIRAGVPDQLERLTEKSVMGLAFDKKGQLWVGTDGKGLNVFSPERKRLATYEHEGGSIVTAATRDSYGNLWFGSFYQGATVKMAGGGFRKVLPNAHEDVRCFYEDDKQQMWIGTSHGIYVVDIKRMKVVNNYHLGNDMVRAICMDAREGTEKGTQCPPRHRVWVGYFDIGIEVFSPQMKRIKSFNSTKGEKEYIPSNAVNHLMRDSQGRIWAATNEGAICFDVKHQDRHVIYDQRQGMSNIHVRAIIEDEMHNIWMSTNRGISCLKSGQAGRFINFNEKDNVVKANFNDGSVARSEQGIIYFGSAQGLCSFLPRRVLSVNRAPKTIITSLRLIRGIEQPDSVINLAMRNHISLAYDENSFSVNFTVQNFAMENYVEYSYKLSGLQDDWITAQNGTITLRDIPPGTYQLQVRTRLHNQPWSSEIAEFTITVRPPFWLSWWAKLCYTLFVLAIVYLALRTYQRHLRLKFQLKAEKVNHEKEQKLNEERLRFFTNITHELRTPLTLILGPLDDISHSSDITKAVKHKLAVIHQSAVRLNELITQILEFRKTETDNRRLCVVKANVVDAVHEVSLKYEELARKPDVAIRFVAPENPILMYIDKEVIAIILDNLVSNAIKYTDQGNIDISVERRRSGERHLVDITVSDTGHGISAKALPHIFDRYYQENGTHQASGTGIGLSLVKKLVTLHHGEVKAESNLEQGTSFIVTLDENEIYPEALRGDENASAKSQGNDAASDVLNSEEAVLSVENGKLLLLVVEDNREILDYVAESFIDEFDVLKAGDGREGLALALDKVPDVIISDVMMPNMDGNAMCRALKKDVRTSHIPIILLTAKDSFEAKEKGYDSGADSYITKPFTHKLLRSRILNLLQQRRRDKMLIQESKETNLAQKKEQLREALNKVDQEFFDKLNKLIEENISGDVDVNLIASNLAVSTSTLYRKMKALTGISTNEYIRKYKMQYAEHLLLEGKYSISEISFMVGMNSVAYFRRCFKAEYGEIPSEYLKNLQKM